MTWGLTYDDGPAFYTPNLLQYLNSQNLRATFFTIGSRVISNPYTLQEEYMGGNQIGVHTWSHPSLTTLTTDQIIAELGWARKAIKDVIGVTPNTMRPPYGDIECVFTCPMYALCFALLTIDNIVTASALFPWPWA
jgi:peptidoglycan/xylan/chitin deacetylase (PgdA/CDA1 family)